MDIPNYRSGNITNFMSSILHGFGSKSNYPQDKLLTSEIKEAKNVVLFIIDGLGYDSYQYLPANAFFHTKTISKLQTVFPSSTAPAISTFLSGLPPQNSGITGWDMHLQEVGSIASILPFQTYQGLPLLADANILSFPQNIFEKINAKSHFIIKKNLLKSPYNSYMATKAQTWPITNLRSFCSKINKAVKQRSTKRKFIFAYWGEFDMLSHHFGKQHPKTKLHLLELHNKITALCKKLTNSNTLFLITADHGQMITSKKKVLFLDQHAKLKECLTMPICGESRAAFCYVHPRKQQQFEQYVNQKMKRICTLHKSVDLVSKQYFGLGKRHPKLLSRLGDYILIPKENYIFRYAPGSNEFHIGNHGGLTDEEMYVPLIKIQL